jgi:hypothetical protein
VQAPDLPSRWSRTWALAVLASTLAVVVVHRIGAPEIVLAPITLWFIAICPGMAFVRLLQLDQPIAEVMLAFALSLALAGLVPAVFLYLGAWSPGWSLAMLVAISATGLALDPLIVPRRGWSSPTRVIRDQILLFAGRVAPRMGDVPPSTMPSVEAPLARRAPPPIAVVTRLRSRAAPMSVEERSSTRGRTLGSDPLAEDESSFALRSAFDRVIGEIATRRQRDE